MESIRQQMPDLSRCLRIAIIGCPGSGKSTLARQIAAITGHPLIPLDYHYWQPGLVPTPKDEWRAKQEQWVKGERWIIDGNYSGTIELRFAAADLVIFLDFPRPLCIWRVIFRHGKKRPDMRPDVVEGGVLSLGFFALCGVIWRFRKDSLPQILALHEKYPGVEFVRIKSQRDLDLLYKK